jgi:hypothetical protein
MIESELLYHQTCLSILQSLFTEVKGIRSAERPDEQLSLKEMAASLSSGAASVAATVEEKKINYAAKTGNMVLPSAAAASVASSINSRSSSPMPSFRNSSQKKYVQAAFDFEAEGPGELTSMIFYIKLSSSQRGNH